MTTNNQTPQLNPDSDNELTGILKSATRLTPLQLNGIRLDVRHTILTPEYLDNLQ